MAVERISAWWSGSPSAGAQQWVLYHGCIMEMELDIGFYTVILVDHGDVGVVDGIGEDADIVLA